MPQRAVTASTNHFSERNTFMPNKGWHAITLALCCVMTGCGLTQAVKDGTVSMAKSVFYKKIKTLHLDFSARAALNVDGDQTPLATMVRVYQLKDRKTLDAADYGSLLQNADTVLKDDLLASRDPDRPHIAHAFHDSAHPDVVSRDNRSRNILRTPAQNELRMEDKRGEEHIHLTTEYGKTQLGEGQLVDGQDKPRGAGFELRTDEYGVIRVAKGLFISADGQQKAAGEVLDRETALKEIDLCLQQIAQLSASADAANALQADIASQSAMFSERLKPLNELIHMQAPDGMAFTSGEHTQLTATKNVAVSAGGDISVGVMGNMTALAGEKLGLFAHSGPLSLKSGEGPLEVQAQNGGMQLAAEKKVTLTSVSDISFAGKKRITLIGGGSYLKLEAGKIEYGTPQVYLRKVEKTYLGASKSRQVEFPYLPGKEGVYSRGFILLDDRTNEPAAGIAYRLTLSSGEKVENVSNNKGCTYIMSH
ncbi:type VI secretion system lipoprotein TssJ, partial [Cronobacter sakazakii]|nr:type VI secretion system lipoprotein TssJ [Cronobacter sakazakii]